MWALLMAFRDVSWLAERTNVWDAIGVVSYGLIIAFVESVLVFLVVALIGLVTPGSWTSNQRIVFLSLLLMITALWAVISQLLYLWDVWLPDAATRFLRDSEHPLRILYAASLSLVMFTVLLPVYFFLRAKQAVPFLQSVIERVADLTMFYMFFDLIGLVVVVIRNMS
jgi:hypothetical protein